MGAAAEKGRRAARDGYELGLHKPFLFELVDLVGKLMGDQYPEVRENAAQCRAVIKGEEENFLTVYRQGMAKLDEFLAHAAKPGPGQWTAGGGEFAFTLHDTFGFPVDITQKVMEERGHRLDEGAFEAAMEAQRQRARASMATADAVFTASVAVKLRDAKCKPSTFTGYRELATTSRLVGIVGDNDTLLSFAKAGQKILLVTESTPFYAQGGGQVGDRGVIRCGLGEAHVTNTTALDGFHLHHAVVASGQLDVGSVADLAVDESARRATERNHTATHLLHAALKRVLGDHVSQAGSEVSPDRLRFDYTQPEKPTAEHLQRVEDLVNGQILLASATQACVQQLDEARANGFVALFGEKYGETVRTLQVGDFSRELCGGTHVATPAGICPLRIVSESSVGQGVRRIEAVTSGVAIDLLREREDPLAILEREHGALQRVLRRLRQHPARVGRIEHVAAHVVARAQHLLRHRAARGRVRRRAAARGFVHDRTDAGAALPGGHRLSSREFRIAVGGHCEAFGSSVFDRRI